MGVKFSENVVNKIYKCKNASLCMKFGMLCKSKNIYV